MDIGTKSTFSRLDFSDLIPSTNKDDSVIIDLTSQNNIHHSFPKIDRCCKFSGREITFDDFDNMQRIKCDISKAHFSREFVRKREVVILQGCQDNWPARNWTLENLLSRYDSDWYTQLYEGKEKECVSGSLQGHQISNLIKNMNHKLLPHRMKQGGNDPLL